MQSMRLGGPTCYHTQQWTGNAKQAGVWPIPQEKELKELRQRVSVCVCRRMCVCVHMQGVGVGAFLGQMEAALRWSHRLHTSLI